MPACRHPTAPNRPRPTCSKESPQEQALNTTCKQLQRQLPTRKTAAAKPPAAPTAADAAHQNHMQLPFQRLHLATKLRSVCPGSRQLLFVPLLLPHHAAGKCRLCHPVCCAALQEPHPHVGGSLAGAVLRKNMLLQRASPPPAPPSQRASRPQVVDEPE